jgi:hypothetical protein
MKNISLLCLLLGILTITSACTPQQPVEPIIQVETLIHTVEVTREVEVTMIIEIPVTVTPTLTPAVTDTPTPDYSPTSSLTPSMTFTVTPTPTFVVPRGKVNSRAQCRYGPGAAYLYKYGLFEGTVMEIIGRNELGTWAYIQAIGGNNPCWINASLLNITRGDFMGLPVTYNRLPQSDLYKPPKTVSATRLGNEVTIFWSAVYMTEDDYRGYLIESWLCQDGQTVFTPVRSDELAVKLVDEPGCLEPSGARVYTAEKHGYTQWRLVPWPPYENTPTPAPENP